MDIYLVRHGETDWNTAGKFQGLEDIPLNNNGISQSIACAEAFRHTPIGLIVSSPLKRAVVTAEIIAGSTGVSRIEIDHDLIERDFGKIAGMTTAERDQFMAGLDDPQMEPRKNVAARMLRAVGKLCRGGYRGASLIVSHGAAINVLLSELSGGGIGTGKTFLKNACISRLNCSEGTMKLEFYNMTAGELISGADGVLIPSRDNFDTVIFP